MPRHLMFAAALIGLLLVSGVASAQSSTPQLLKVQGFLSDAISGPPVPATGPFSMTFRLYDDELAGLLLAQVGPLTVNVSEGVYEVELPFPASVFDGTQRFLEIEVESELLAPRLRVVSTPFAYMAEKVGGFAAADLDQTDELAAHAALQDAHREHASLEESAEIVAAVGAHEAASDPHPTYVDGGGDTMSGALTISAPSTDPLQLTAPGDVRVSFTSGGGPAHTFGWEAARDSFALSDALALDSGKLLYWPMNTGPSAGVATYSFSKLATLPPGQTEHPDGELDETFQFCYNCRDDGSTFPADPTQHAWNQKFEANYWNSSVGREQLEVNWNYTDPSGFKWRPFAYVLWVTGNCNGGSKDGDPCASAQQIADCEGGGGVCEGDNWAKWDWSSSPFGLCSLDHSIRCTTAGDCPGGSCVGSSDMALEAGRGRLISSHGILVDVFHPGTASDSSYSAVQVDQDVEPIDTTKPFYGLQLSSSFTNAAQPDSAAASWIGLRASQVFAGSEPDGRFVGDRLVGVEVRQELSQTALAGPAGGGETVPVLSGVSWRLQPTGSHLSVGSAAGLRLESPDDLAGGGTEVTIGELDGIRVEDLKGYGVDNHAIRIESQSGSAGDAGNLQMDGGGAIDGHLRLGDGHLWYDGATNMFRWKDGSGGGAPASDADGTPVHAPAGMSSDWGEALWGRAAGALATADEVCAQAGLTCVGAFDLGSRRERDCAYSNWSGDLFLALCR